MTTLLRPFTALLLAIAAGLAIGPAPAAATQTHMFADAGPAFPVRLPDDWTVTRMAGGIEVNDKAGDLHFRVQGIPLKDVNATMESYTALFDKQGVASAGQPTKKEETVNQTPVIEMRVPATRNGKPMVIQFLMVGVKPDTDKVLLLGFWSTPEANQARAQDMMQVVRDLVRP